MQRKLSPVDPAQISVVIQGPLYRHLGPSRGIFACIESIRKHLPKAEIVVSTWPNEDLTGVKVDHVVVSEDPGCLTDCSGNQINSNRMLRSTLEGIRAASRPYVMKFRSDHNLRSAAIAVIGDPEPFGPALDDEPRLFKTPITITTLYIRNPVRVPMLFHVSDLVQFGTREDMLHLWDQPLYQAKDVFHPRPYRNPFGNFIGYSSTRAVTEQCLMLGAIRKHGIDVTLDHPCQVRPNDLQLWENILRMNFRALEWNGAGIEFPDRFMSTGFSLRTLYKASEIEKLQRLSPMEFKLRLARIWVNKYLLNCFRPTWWVALASLTLFSTSPTLAKKARTQWRKFSKVVHPDSGRV